MNKIIGIPRVVHDVIEIQVCRSEEPNLLREYTQYWAKGMMLAERLDQTRILKPVGETASNPYEICKKDG
jgi:hypothetical protein